VFTDQALQKKTVPATFLKYRNWKWRQAALKFDEHQKTNPDNWKDSCFIFAIFG
jgi:hypothetical protein